jgi:single-stranded DNA-binding protein
VDPITLTVTGVLYNDPRSYTTGRGNPAVSLWLEVPPRGSGDGSSRYLKVVAYGTLATNVAESLRANDRITVRADDVRAETWRDKDKPRDDDASIRSCVTITAREISPSLLHDTARTGSALRRAAREAATSGQSDGLPASERADLRVLDGVTAGASA